MKALAGLWSGLLICLAGTWADGRDAEIDEAAKLQVFLDRAEFAPGKIDGRYGEFTLRALDLYRQAKDVSAAKDSKRRESEKGGPDVSGLDLSSVEPVFIDYTIAESDARAVGTMAEKVEEQAKQSSMPYHNLLEAVAEKFHCDPKFLAELNHGKTDGLKPGETLRVPNVEPFELGEIKSMKPGEELQPQAANEIEGDKNEADAKEKEGKTSVPMTAEVTVDIKTEMVSVHEGGKLVAAYPVTVGSAHTASPVGEWKVRGFEKMPRFRYDESMLEKGERSANFKMLPPGPNSPVGVLWIALNKKGIGLHGSSEPDTIGRSASHGCIRLANWDVVRLAKKIKFGVPVSIR